MSGQANQRDPGRPLRVRRVESTTGPDGVRRARIALDPPDPAANGAAIPAAIEYRTGDADLVASNDAAVPACLLAAMFRAAPLSLPGDVSARLLEAAQQIQDIFHVWEPILQKIDLQDARPVVREASGGRGRASFFTGGVDSFYTALEHRDEIDAIVYVAGFDIPLADRKLLEITRKRLGDAASALGKRLIWVESTYREWVEAEMADFPLHSVWGPAHGSALASVALLLSDEFERVYVPATFDYREISPWGSHPLLDPLWSTERCEIVHDGCERNRFQKLERICNDDVVRRTLRVCWRNPDGAYNCGRCEKCLRTMISLRAIGALERIETLPDEIDLAAVRAMEVRRDIPPRFLHQNIRALRARGGETDLIHAIEAAIDGSSPWSRWARRLARRALGQTPPGRTVR